MSLGGCTTCMVCLGHQFLAASLGPHLSFSDWSLYLLLQDLCLACNYSFSICHSPTLRAIVAHDLMIHSCGHLQCVTVVWSQGQPHQDFGMSICTGIGCPGAEKIFFPTVTGMHCSCILFHVHIMPRSVVHLLLLLLPSTVSVRSSVPSQFSSDLTVRYFCTILTACWQYTIFLQSFTKYVASPISQVIFYWTVFIDVIR